MTNMAIDFTLSPELEDIRLRVRTFIEEVVKPGEAKIWRHRRAIASGSIARSTSRSLFGMRQAAKDAGLWLPHMPEEWGGMGLGHVELAMVQAEAAKAALRAVRAQLPGARRRQHAHAAALGAPTSRRRST